MTTWLFFLIIAMGSGWSVEPHGYPTQEECEAVREVVAIGASSPRDACPCYLVTPNCYRLSGVLDWQG